MEAGDELIVPTMTLKSLPIIFLTLKEEKSDFQTLFASVKMENTSSLQNSQMVKRLSKNFMWIKMMRISPTGV